MRYAFYFEFDSDDDPYDWSWANLIDSVEDDNTQIDYSSIRLEEL